MPHAHFCFEEFELDTESCELRRLGYHLKVERMPMQLLMLLLETPGKLVRREIIVERLWGQNVFVETEHSINTAVNKLRSILRDDPRNPRFIRTAVGQGYCFIAQVSVLQPVQEPAIAGSLSSLPLESLPATTPVTGNGHSPKSDQAEAPAFPGFQSSKNGTPAAEPPAVTANKTIGSKAWLIGGVIGFLAALVVVALVVYWRRSEKVSQESQRPEVHSVAVLPFRNLAQTSDQDYLVDGMTDQLTTELARSTSLHVISQRSAMQYKGVEKPLQEIARALNVDIIVEGSYLHEGKQVRITAQLLDARNDRHLWAQTYDESDKDLLTVQDRVTNDMAQQIAIALGGNFARSKEKAVNPGAREAYLRGRYFWNERTRTSIVNSVKYYSDAIREDPNYAAAYAGLAEAYVLQASYGDSDPSDSLWKAQYAAERALDLDNTLGEAHTALGAVLVERDWDWTGAEREYKLALKLNPADATAHHWYSLHLSRMRRPREAEIEIQRALALDPLSLIINTDAAETAYWAGDLEKALTRADGVLALDPDFAEGHLTKGKILVALHHYSEAQVEYRIGKRLGNFPYYVDALQIQAMALAGDKADALKRVKELEAGWPANGISGSEFAMVYCGLHDIDSAMKWFDIAYRKHSRDMDMIGVDPVYDGCREDPRFASLLQNLHMPAVNH